MSTLRNSPTKPTTTTHPPERRSIRTCTYNIIHAGANNLNMALRAMHHMRVVFGFFTETKLSHDKYTHEYQGYKVYAMTSSPNQGGVVLFFRNSNQWTVEGVRSFGPNIIRCSLVSGSHRWTIFGIYIPPSESNGETLHWLEQASIHSTRHPVIVMGDLNVDLDHIRDDRGHDIADALALLGVSDVSAQFPHSRGRWTWSQARQDRYIRSVTDYVLSSSPKDFSRWAIKYPRYCSDHRAIVGEIRVDGIRQHKQYVCKHKPSLISYPRPLLEIDQAFVDLTNLLEHEPTRPVYNSSSWIQDDTWKAIDKRAALSRRHRFHHHVDDEPVAKRTRSHYAHLDDYRGQQMLNEPGHPTQPASRDGCIDECLHKFKLLKREIQSKLRRDRKNRARDVAAQASSLLASDQVHEAYRTIQGWYRQRTGNNFPPLDE